MAQLRWQCHLLRCNRKLDSSVTSTSAAKYTRINFDIIGENIFRFGCFQQSLYCLSMYLYVNVCVFEFVHVFIYRLVNSNRNEQASIKADY